MIMLDFARKNQYIKEEMFWEWMKNNPQQLIPFSPFPGRLYGYYIGCDFCGRERNNKKTCEGCGA